MIPAKEIIAEHLAGAIRFPTISNADDGQMDFESFYSMHRYLEETYPLIHKTFEKEIIGHAALLYHWKTPKPCGKLPLLLMAHQDVVPVGNEAEWRFPPFSGTIAEGCIWGRGALDCKSLMIGELEAVEALVAEGFVPDYDLYLAFGYNEEVGTTAAAPSAKLIADELAKRGVTLGVVVDEGAEIQSGNIKGYDGKLAYIAVSEKGSASYEIYKCGKGGHPIKAGRENILADVARAVTRIADYPRPYRITPEMKRQFKVLAPYMGDKEPIYSDIDAHQQELAQLLENENPLTVAKFQSTMAMTQCSGSPNPGMLPTKVSVKMNMRMNYPDTAESLLNEYRELVKDLGVSVELLQGRGPSPSSDIDCKYFDVMETTIKSIYPDIEVLPSVCIGGTDAYFYYNVCEHVYRFSGTLKVPENGPSHGPNEKFSLESVLSIPVFFYHYVQNY